MIAPPGALEQVAAPVAERRTVHSVFAVVILLLPLLLWFFSVLEPVADPDIWWHLAAGRWMLDHRTVPSVDPFMTGGVAHEWINYSWLADLGFWLGYRAVGLAMPIVYAGIMAGSVLLLCSRLVRREGSDLVRRSFVAAIGFMALSAHFGPRTYLFTLLFTGITLCFLRASFGGADVRRGYALVPVFALWANVHIEFIYGLFFLGLATLDCFLRRRFSSPASGQAATGVPSWKQLALLTTTLLGATLVNPFGPRLHAFVVAILGAYDGNDFVSEMRATRFRSTLDYLILLLFGGAVFTLARVRSRDLYRWGALAVSAYMSFHSERASWLVMVVALDILGDHPLLFRSSAAPPPGVPEVVPRLYRWTLPTAVAIAVLGLTLRAVHNREAFVPTKFYPFGAASFARKEALVGPLFNDWNWGGFLRFELPEVPANIDGRGKMVGVKDPVSTIATWSGKPSWKSDPELDSAGFVVANTKSALAQLLRFDARFRAAYEDDVALVFVRQGR